ncbi:MAG: rhamnulokinase, partial [Eubacteriales bacterium]|nr:rhamnulokinase [Eubacteriales bacterium]
MKYVLAIDIGNSSGRHLLGSIQKGRLFTQEIYRFENKIIRQNDTLCWDLTALCNHILAGIKKCKKIGLIPDMIGIDTWGLDYVLLDEDGAVIAPPVCYRDARTKEMMEEVFHVISKEELYQRTGIQFMRFNTLFQLYHLLSHHPDQLARAKELLLMPGYFSYFLTGVKANEYTDATTTQLVNACTRDWDYELIEQIGLDRNMFKPVSPPGSLLGGLKKEIQTIVGFDAQVMLPPSHDTASAYAAAPNSDDRSIILSSGTWSLLGIETSNPICTERSCELNFTNEGGYGYRFRFLKNITGMWMMQEVMRNYNNQYTYEQLNKLMQQEQGFLSAVDVENEVFVNPENMIEAIRNQCAITGQKVPYAPGEIGKCIINSLSINYKSVVDEIEKITGVKRKRILIVGGGCNNKLLNQAVADQTGKEVFAGP